VVEFWMAVGVVAGDEVVLGHRSNLGLDVGTDLSGVWATSPEPTA
jgi:hypothetical protein